MIEINEKDTHLPFGNLVIEIMEETWYDFEDEELKEETTIIGTYVLPSMKYELPNGSFIEKAPSNEKKRKAKSQEIPIEI